ncbi:uncharacterized protein LOC107404961 [Ziziphus jujuba]|uniref:Uncharacterized protein LOC107404961 n=1 Tax=Ziziphus jujuba TaxID=326968 RepID=A0A6P3YZT3_ZIZJJ|nr:uncharacterized protein LOC107404961 [Ziziphus jujuba]
MAASSKCDPPAPPPPLPPQTFPYTPLPSDHQNYVVLPIYYPSSRRRLRSISAFCLVLFAATVFVLWPSEPDLKIVRMHLNRIHIHTTPHVSIDVSILLTLKVRNADVYSMEYRALEVTVGYRGKVLGHVRSDNGRVRARGASYVDAEMDLYGVELFSDVVFLLEDLAKGTVPFTAVTEVQGQLGFLFFYFPLQAKVSCEVSVNTVNQTIVRQNCYHE